MEKTGSLRATDATTSFRQNPSVRPRRVELSPSVLNANRTCRSRLPMKMDLASSVHDALTSFAFHYANGVAHPNDVADPAWNTRTATGEAIRRDLVVLSCKTVRDFLAVSVLQLTAKQEDPRFMMVRKAEHDAALLLNRSRNAYVGFLVWSEYDAQATLNQIYVAPACRRRGLASAALKWWVENRADRLNERFNVESPNASAQALLVSLGYARKEEKHVVGIKCSFVAGL